MKILAIGAHYDDVEIGCGGMLLKRADKGDEITILTITDSGYSVPNTNISRSSIVAKAEAQEAAGILGAKLICLDKPTLELTHNESFSYEFDAILTEIQPDIVLTHWGGDFHSDHAAVSVSSIRASRRVKKILLYRSNWYATETVFKENYFVDISTFLERKLELITVYKSVLEPINYSWLEFIRKENEFQGLKIGVAAAESFSCIKYVD